MIQLMNPTAAKQAFMLMQLSDQIIIKLDLSDSALQHNIRILEMYARLNWMKAKQGFEFVDSDEWSDAFQCYPEIKERISKVDIKHFKKLADRAYAVSRMLKRKLKLQNTNSNQINFIYA